MMTSQERERADGLAGCLSRHKSERVPTKEAEEDFGEGGNDFLGGLIERGDAEPFCAVEAVGEDVGECGEPKQERQEQCGRAHEVEGVKEQHNE